MDGSEADSDLVLICFDTNFLRFVYIESVLEKY